MNLDLKQISLAKIAKAAKKNQSFDFRGFYCSEFSNRLLPLGDLGGLSRVIPESGSSPTTVHEKLTGFAVLAQMTI